MNHLVATGLSSFAVSLVLGFLFFATCSGRFVLCRTSPTASGKYHVHPIPRVGGIAIAVSYFLVFYLVRQTDGVPVWMISGCRSFFRILPAGLLVFATGLVDDLFGLKPWQKFIGQFAAAGLAYWGGVHMSVMGGHVLPEIWLLPFNSYMAGALHERV